MSCHRPPRRQLHRHGALGIALPSTMAGARSVRHTAAARCQQPQYVHGSAVGYRRDHDQDRHLPAAASCSLTCELEPVVVRRRSDVRSPPPRGRGACRGAAPWPAGAWRGASGCSARPAQPCASSRATTSRDRHADRGAGGHQALDRLRAAEFELHVQRPDTVEQPALDRLARPEPGSRRAQVASRRLRTLAVPSAKACVGADDDHHLVGQPRPHDQLGVRLRPFDEADIDLERRHRGDHLAGIADHQVHRAGRVVDLPASQQLRQQVLADRQAGRDAQGGRRVRRRTDGRPRRPGRAARRPGAAARGRSRSAPGGGRRGRTAPRRARPRARPAPALAADCERATWSAAARVEPARAVATKTSSWRRFRRSRGGEVRGPIVDLLYWS